jgi:Flp pilus assembly protein TadG
MVEFGLALPLLLMLFLGLVDGARAYYYASNLANAAREAANYAARNSNATLAQVTQRACDETGLAPFGTACPGFQVTCTTGGGDVWVEVRYDFSLISGYAVDALFHVNPVPIRAIARFPILTSGTPCVT